MSAEIEVLHPGLYSSIQDTGRYGFAKYGVPASGAMDNYAAQMANLILHNEPNAAVLEMTQMGPKLLFKKPTKIVICGAVFAPKINELEIENNSVCTIKSGDVLSFGKIRKGCRAYLAVFDGFNTETVLNSRSWYEGITEYSRLEKGMTLSFEPHFNQKKNLFASLKSESTYLSQIDIPIFTGPEFQFLNDRQQEDLFSETFAIGASNNRMAIQLAGTFKNSLKPIITGPVLPGTVQLTPSGKLIVLMKDCQTTGGYPRVLQLSELGINAIAQKVTGEKIKFERVQRSKEP